MADRDYELIEGIRGAGARRGVPLSSLCTFRTGGTAKLVAEPLDAESLKKILEICYDAGLPHIVAGNGSNVLFSDLGYDGVIIRTVRMRNVSVDGCLIRAECGASLSGVSSKALSASLTGFEFADGIPGTVGGGIFMNAGAYGREMKDVVSCVTALDTSDLETVRIKGPECGFGYRASRFRSGDMIVLSAEFSLEKGDKSSVRDEIGRLRELRREKQPLNYPSAGSAFKRPEGDYAARLIDLCGLRGFSAGGAGVSEKHAGFVINRGGATSGDVIAVMSAVRRTVFEKTGVMLEPEIRYVPQIGETIPDVFASARRTEHLHNR